MNDYFCCRCCGKKVSSFGFDTKTSTSFNKETGEVVQVVEWTTPIRLCFECYKNRRIITKEGK